MNLAGLLCPETREMLCHHFFALILESIQQLENGVFSP